MWGSRLSRCFLADLDLFLQLWCTFKKWIAAAFGTYRGRSLADDCSFSSLNCCIYVIKERGRSITVKLATVHYWTRRYRRKKTVRTPSVRCMSLMTQTRRPPVMTGSITTTSVTLSSQRWFIHVTIAVTRVHKSLSVRQSNASSTKRGLQKQSVWNWESFTLNSTSGFRQTARYSANLRQCVVKLLLFLNSKSCSWISCTIILVINGKFVVINVN